MELAEALGAEAPQNLSPHLVEFHSAARFVPGNQLWVSLSGFTGWPASVVEVDQHHYLAEFRLPLRQTDFALLAPSRFATR